METTVKAPETNEPMLAIQDFNKLYKENKSLVMSWIKAKFPCNEDAEDICSMVFVKVWKHLGIYDVKRAKFSTWLFEITKNACVDYFRQEGTRAMRYVNVDSFVDSEGETFDASNFFTEAEDTERVVENKYLGEELEKAMQTLKPNYRMVAEMYMRQDRSYNEIAEILDIPLGTVKATLMRAKEMLQRELAGTRRLMYA